MPCFRIPKKSYPGSEKKDGFHISELGFDLFLNIQAEAHLETSISSDSQSNRYIEIYIH